MKAVINDEALYDIVQHAFLAGWERRDWLDRPDGAKDEPLRTLNVAELARICHDEANRVIRFLRKKKALAERNRTDLVKVPAAFVNDKVFKA